MNVAEAGALAPKLGEGLAQQIAVAPRDIAGDATIDVTKDQTLTLSKGSAAAITLPVPGAANIGRRIVIISASAFAHVVTATLEDGTTGAHVTATYAAFAGASAEFWARTATIWTARSLTAVTVA